MHGHMISLTRGTQSAGGPAVSSGTSGGGSVWAEKDTNGHECMWIQMHGACQGIGLRHLGPLCCEETGADIYVRAGR